MVKSNMYRNFGLFVGVLISCCLIGCGNRTSQEESEIIYEHALQPVDEEETINLILENENIPDDLIETLSNRDQSYLLNYAIDEIIQSIISLDTDSLYKYVDEETCDRVIPLLNGIKESEIDLQWWEDIMGTCKYFPADGILLRKDSDYTFAKWYTDQCTDGVSPFEYGYLDEYMTSDIAYDLYEQYYKDAPYSEFKIDQDFVSFEVVDGQLKTSNINYLLQDESLEDILSNFGENGGENEDGSKIEYIRLLFGYQQLEDRYSENYEDFSFYEEKSLNNLMSDDTIFSLPQETIDMYNKMLSAAEVLRDNETVYYAFPYYYTDTEDENDMYNCVLMLDVRENVEDKINFEKLNVLFDNLYYF